MPYARFVTLVSAWMTGADQCSGSDVMGSDVCSCRPYRALLLVVRIPLRVVGAFALTRYEADQCASSHAQLWLASTRASSLRRRAASGSSSTSKRKAALSAR